MMVNHRKYSVVVEPNLFSVFELTLRTHQEGVFASTAWTARKVERPLCHHDGLALS